MFSLFAFSHRQNTKTNKWFGFILWNLKLRATIVGTCVVTPPPPLMSRFSFYRFVEIYARKHAHSIYFSKNKSTFWFSTLLTFRMAFASTIWIRLNFKIQFISTILRSIWLSRSITSGESSASGREKNKELLPFLHFYWFRHLSFAHFPCKLYSIVMQCSQLMIRFEFGIAESKTESVMFLWRRGRESGKQYQMISNDSTFWDGFAVYLLICYFKRIETNLLQTQLQN